MDDKTYYDSIAKEYKGIQAVMHSSKLLARYRHFLEWVVLNRYLEHGNKNILDIGCGNGRFFPLFIEKGYSIQGLDFSKELINQASVNFKVPLHQGSCHQLPYKNNSFDIIFLILVLPHDDKFIIEKTMDEVKRVLKPDGKIFIIDEPYTEGSVWNLETIKSLLGDQFELIENRFIRSDFFSQLVLGNNQKDIKKINHSKCSKIKGNIFKDLIKISLDIWLDLPQIIFKVEDRGFERLLIYQHIKNEIG